MDNKNQEEFINWLKEKLEVKDEEEFQTKVERLGEKGIREAAIEFEKQKVASYMVGGKLEKVKKLNLFLQSGGQIRERSFIDASTLNYQNKTGSGDGQILATAKNGLTVTQQRLDYARKNGLHFNKAQELADYLDLQDSSNLVNSNYKPKMYGYGSGSKTAVGGKMSQEEFEAVKTKLIPQHYSDPNYQSNVNGKNQYYGKEYLPMQDYYMRENATNISDFLTKYRRGKQDPGQLVEVSQNATPNADLRGLPLNRK